jgi:hypothetical protein
MKLSDNIKLLLLSTVLVAMIVLLGYLLNQIKHGTIIYNCQIAEISPDVPPKVKEECRKLMEKH